MTKNQILMRQAKQMLAGNWGNVALATLIYMIIIGVVSCSYVGQLILIGPISVGYVLFIMAVCDRRIVDFGNLFKGFDNFVQTLVAGLIYSIAGSIGMFFLVVPGIIISMGFGMTFFIMAEQPGISGVDALKTSWNMMKGHKWDYFCLNLRFIGWGLLAILTFGIGMLWLTPYVTTAGMNFYRDLRYNVNRG